MPKAKSALFTGISGSLRKSVTFRDTTQTPDITMQTRPVPTDRRTAKQAAVRDAYARLAWLWKNLSHLDKEPYEIMAEQRNLTPWNCWLSFHLPLMRLGPKFYTTFSEGAGTSIQDFAIGGGTGILNGPIWQEKNQFPALSFDGVDDQVTFVRPGYYDTAQSFTFYSICSLTTIPSGPRTLLGTMTFGSQKKGLWFVLLNNRKAYMEFGTGTQNRDHSSTGLVNPNALNSIAYYHSGNLWGFIVNGIKNEGNSSVNIINPSIYDLKIGRLTETSTTLSGKLHVAALIPKLLTPLQIATLDAHYLPYLT